MITINHIKFCRPSTDCLEEMGIEISDDNNKAIVIDDDLNVVFYYIIIKRYEDIANFNFKPYE